MAQFLVKPDTPDIEKGCQCLRWKSRGVEMENLFPDPFFEKWVYRDVKLQEKKKLDGTDGRVIAMVIESAWAVKQAM